MPSAIRPIVAATQWTRRVDASTVDESTGTHKHRVADAVGSCCDVRAVRLVVVVLRYAWWAVSGEKTGFAENADVASWSSFSR